MMNKNDGEVLVVGWQPQSKTAFSTEEKTNIREKLIANYLAGNLLALRRHIQICPKCGEPCRFKLIEQAGLEVDKMLPACNIQVKVKNGELLVPSFFIHMLEEHDDSLDSNLRLLLL